MIMMSSIFWDIKMCISAEIHWHSRETYYHHHWPWRWRQYIPPKQHWTYTGLHSVNVNSKRQSKMNVTKYSENVIWQKLYLILFLNDASDSMNKTYIVIYWQRIYDDHDVKTNRQGDGRLKYAAVHSKFAEFKFPYIFHIIYPHLYT
jgi:hypothetical protein